VTNWPEVRLGDACDRITDGSHFSPKSSSEGFPYVTVRDLSDGAIDLDGSKRISRESFNELSRNGCSPQKGDVLFSKDGTVGKVALVGVSIPFVVLSSIAILSPNHELVSSEYLAWVLKSPSVQSMAVDKKTGTALRRLILRDLNSILIPLPPLDEQKRIVAKLDEVSTRVGDYGRSIHLQSTGLADLRSSLCRESFLNAPEVRTRYLIDLAQNLDSRRVPITKDQRQSGSVPYYGASGIVDYVQDSLFNEPLLLVSEDGANLLSRSTPIAFPIDGPTWVNNHAHILRFDNPITQAYVELFIENTKIDQYVTGAAQPKLNQKALNSIPIQIPISIEDQRAVVQLIKSRNLLIDNALNLNKKRNGLSRVLLSSTMSHDLENSA